MYKNPQVTRMARIRGLELLFNLVKGQLQSKFDCAVAAVHCLLTNEGLQCHGCGDTFLEDDKPSELLPSGWNGNQEVYTLRYIGKNPKGKYLLKAVKTGNHIMHINVVFEDDEAATIAVNVDKIIGENFQEYESAYLDISSLINNFQRDIYEKLFVAAKSSASSKPKSPDVRPAQPVAPPIHGPGPNPRFQQDPLRVGQPSFPQVGGLDLDPFGRGYGGMFYDPLQQPRNPRIFDPSGFGVAPIGGPGGLPRGSVPPGARFDPFGPSMGGPNIPRPSPDHFKPPDFDDFI